MKMNTNLRLVENNATTTKGFTIQASGKMFHMVISGLYSNKPQSITREIWSNAFDAHAMVGKETEPFLVTFPTALSPTFSCRDFGPGIAHGDMEGFYTVLGHSTKENTNTAVGKWGVGRMSPMSYTDTFSVVSYHKGEVSYYAVQLGPDGSPQLHVLAPPQFTTEPDGLEVSFPVKRQDIDAFQKAAEVVAYGFPVPPRVTNSKEKEFSQVNKIFEGKDFYLYEDRKLGGAYAQMGCVMYPIPLLYLPRMMNIVYKFDIGELEVTASRESLSFGPNDPTEANIRKKAAEVELSMWKMMQDQIEAQPKLFDAAKLAPSFRRHLPHKAAPFTYKGKELPKFWDLAKYTNISISTGDKGYRQRMAGWGLGRDIAVQNNYKMFIQDLSDKKANARAATRIGSAVDSYGYFIWVRADLSDPVQKAEVDQLIGELGYPVTYVKDLPDDGPVVSGPRAKVSVSIIKHGDSPQKWDMDDATFQTGGYYYPMSNNEFPRILYSLSHIVHEKLGQHVILVPKSLWKKFEGNRKWQLLEPAITAVVKAEADNARKVLGCNYDAYPMSNFKAFKDLIGPVGDFARKVVAPQPHMYLGAGRSSWRGIFDHYNLPALESDKPVQEYKALLDKYPLLKVTMEYKGSNFQPFVQYINLIDNANASAKGAN
jgi:hypothetical protein